MLKEPVPTLINPGPSRRGWHRAQNAILCPRKYALRLAKAEVGGLRAPLLKGTMLHTALAHHYARLKATQRGNDPNKFFEPIDAVDQLILLQPVEHRDVWRIHQDLINQTYEAYAVHWAGEQIEVKDIERELKSSILDLDHNESYLYTQRVDLVFRHPQSKKWWFVDHKTTSRLTNSSLRQYTLSGQFLGYQMLGKGFFGEKWGGVMLNMIQWPTKGGRPVLQRTTVEAAPHALSYFKNTIIHAERTIRSHQHLENPMDWPGAHNEFACWTRYGPCEYHTKCQWG